MPLPPRKKTLDFVVIYEGVNYSGKPNYLKPQKYKVAGGVDAPAGTLGFGLANDSIKSIKIPRGWQATLYEHWYFNGINLPLTESCPDLSVHNFSNITSSIFIGNVGEAVASEEPPVIGNAIPAPAPAVMFEAYSLDGNANRLSVLAAALQKS